MDIADFIATRIERVKINKDQLILCINNGRFEFAEIRFFGKARFQLYMYNKRVGDPCSLSEAIGLAEKICVGKIKPQIIAKYQSKINDYYSFGIEPYGDFTRIEKDGIVFYFFKNDVTISYDSCCWLKLHLKKDSRFIIYRFTDLGFMPASIRKPDTLKKLICSLAQRPMDTINLPERLINLIEANEILYKLSND